MKHTVSGPICLLAGLLSSCVVDDDLSSVDEAVSAVPDVTIDARRSLAVTDQTILARFPLQRVLDQLVAQSDVPNLTALDLFHQWWDTQNPLPGLGAGAHCDDVLDERGQPALNGFPLQCRPAPSEGALAAVDPFTAPDSNPEAYLPIGLFMRFDLAPGDGSSCGEYRIVYARRGGILNAQMRNLIIVEAALANPHPQQELKGCRKIVDFWAELSGIDDIVERADRLEGFYFDGIPSVPPVIHVDHLGGGPTGAGQVRTNQFLQEAASPRVWSLREFKLVRDCTAAGCTAMRFVPVTVKGNPSGALFVPDSSFPQAPAFQALFVDQVEALAAPTLSEIDFDVSDVYDPAQSQASGTTENNYRVLFGTGLNPFRDAIQTKLTALGSTLTPDDVVARAQALSCAGCHRLNNLLPIGGGLTWPSSIGFVHVTEREAEVVAGETRFKISPALTDAFLPKRKQVVEDFLNDRLKKPKKPKDPIGGRRVH